MITGQLNQSKSLSQIEVPPTQQHAQQLNASLTSEVQRSSREGIFIE